jgi:hypothetical protein
MHTVYRGTECLSTSSSSYPFLCSSFMQAKQVGEGLETSVWGIGAMQEAGVERRMRKGWESWSGHAGGHLANPCLSFAVSSPGHEEVLLAWQRSWTQLPRLRTWAWMRPMDSHPPVHGWASGVLELVGKLLWGVCVCVCV